jgi:BirA family biotin operon repressor/biotin-[acetyl-CoA-carboxylase] ligase
MEVIRTHFETIGSTNTWAKENAALFPQDKVSLVTANEQTAGRGRFKRMWVSPSGLNIYATFCFFLDRNRTDIGNIPQVLALSIADALSSLSFSPKLRWPNDVLLSGKKVAGILCETTPLDKALCVILGVGLNVNMPLAILEAIDRPATSMLVEGGKVYDLEDVLARLQELFIKDLDLFLVQGFQSFHSKYCQISSHQQGDLIRFTSRCGIEEGVFQSIAEDGSLELRFSTGEKRLVHSGEIVHSAIDKLFFNH